ncbi:LysR family transcriptional regulator [Brevibacillus parabrevis]|uniref:LysR family transcriptional regulator n=1 Tax=Brevibacillus parabrevis TaxID=54914 RepID=UPI0023804FCC|nr:LysR family transcriptional regulator [Brevibacillus parabrevis]WDV93571.1 LysR family transcriptional regulator [Brevibacillus parabrevis]
MELLQLQYFLTVARLEHVTEAARSLHVTQSSLSKTIQRLEEDLGAPLFDRVGRRLRLNEHGSRFLLRAERALLELEEGKREIRDWTQAEYGTLKLAVTNASTLPGILSEFRKQWPMIHFHVQMVTTQEMLTALRRGEAEFCLSSFPVQDDEIQCQTLFLDPILVAVPKNHRLAGRRSVALAELQGEWFVGVKRGYATRDLVDAVCHEAGFEPAYVYEGDEPARLVTFVEAGIGIAFIPCTGRSLHEQVHYLRIEDQRLAREITLLWHKSRYISRAAQHFRRVVEAYFADVTGNAVLSFCQADSPPDCSC